MTRAPRPATGPVTPGQLVDLGSALSELIAAELPAAVELRHALHRSAEVSGAETETAATVAAALGFPDAPALAGTGRLIRIGPSGGPAIAIRAELDALTWSLRGKEGIADEAATRQAAMFDDFMVASQALRDSDFEESQSQI